MMYAAYTSCRRNGEYGPADKNNFPYKRKHAQQNIGSTLVVAGFVRFAMSVALLKKGTLTIE